MSSRAAVRVGWACDNRCVFCGQDGAPELDGELDPIAALRAARDAGATELSFVGGEPALVPALVDLVARARALGFTAVGVQSNGGALVGRIDALVDAGLTDLHLSIHGARADVHDYHTQIEGSFAAAIATLAAARRRGVAVVVTSVLTRSSMRTLAEMAPLLAGHGVAAWQIAWPEIAGRTVDRFDRVVPRLALALPFALHALDRARRAGIAVAMAGAPACLLGPMAVHVTPARVHAFVETCRGCAARERCTGVDAAYLDRFGSEELHARPSPPVASEMPAALARMFVGTGVLAARTPTRHASAAAARRHLPQLGKSRPAVAEARRGEAVDARALFPELDDE